MKIEVVPHGDECTLLECPPGLFLFKGSLGFKTEYGCHNPHNMEVYCVGSGEAFWGGTDNRANLGDLRVTPAVHIGAE